MIDKGKEVLSKRKTSEKQGKIVHYWSMQLTNQARQTKKGRKDPRKERQKLPTSAVKWDVTRGHEDMKRVIGEYYKQLYTHSFCTLDKMNQFLKKQQTILTHSI